MVRQLRHGIGSYVPVFFIGESYPDRPSPRL